MSVSGLLDRFYPALGESRASQSIRTVTPGFSGARVARVDTDAASYCVRCWPADMSARRLFAIHDLLRHVHRTAVTPVPLPLESRDGSTVVTYQNHLWQVEPWMPGRADFTAQPTTARLTAAMHGLAAWHQSAARFNPSQEHLEWLSAASEKPSPTVEARLRLLIEWRSELPEIEAALVAEPVEAFRCLGQEITTLFRLRHLSVVSELEAVRSISVRQQPCIRDLWHDHLLFEGDRLTGLIDFGAVRTDTIACDLSRLLSSLFPDDPLKWRTALDCYEQMCPLSDGECQLIPPLHRSGVLLSGMTWIRRRIRSLIPEPQMTRIIQRMQHIVAALRAL